MPYDTIDDLPPSVRRHLPTHAQEIYLSAFNNAWRRYADAEPRRREQITHRIAWAAVKRRYIKAGDDWVPLGEVAP
jgi:cation transport regulator